MKGRSSAAGNGSGFSWASMQYLTAGIETNCVLRSKRERETARELTARQTPRCPSLCNIARLNTNHNQQPTTNNQQPTTNNQQPTTNNQQPTTNNQQPTTNPTL